MAIQALWMQGLYALLDENITFAFYFLGILTSSRMYNDNTYAFLFYAISVCRLLGETIASSTCRTALAQ